MSLVEGKQPVTFDGYRFLALNAIQARKDFSSSIFAQLFLLTCWNLMARSVFVGSIMFAHMSWVGDALQITIPLHKGDQDVEVVTSVEDTIGGYERKIEQLKLSV